MPENKDKTQENKCESKFLDTPRTEEEQKALYLKVYDDDYLDEKFEKHYPYSEKFDNDIKAILDAKLGKCKE